MSYHRIWKKILVHHDVSTKSSCSPYARLISRKNTDMWQFFGWRLPLHPQLKHIKTFSSGSSKGFKSLNLKVLQAPYVKWNDKSGCFLVSHPTILINLKCVIYTYMIQYMIYWIWYTVNPLWYTVYSIWYTVYPIIYSPYNMDHIHIW